MADPQKPRARGRGAKPTPAGPGAAASTSSAAPVSTAGSGGRARARATTQSSAALSGGGGGDRPGGGVSQITQQMAQTNITSTGSDTDNGNSSVGRGALRGRRRNNEAFDNFIWTRPKHIVNKKATACNAKIDSTQFLVNYFRVNKTPSWTLNLYRVDFNPPEDILMIKKALLREHKDKLGAYIFDGTMMFTIHTIHSGEMKLMSCKRDEVQTPVEISIRLVKNLAHGDYQYLQLFNLLMRDTFRALGLKLLGREFFDPQAKQDIREFKLEVWPGYETVMRQHENDILLCVEIKHKVLRLETALELWEQCRDDRKAYETKMTNVSVLTKYNNKTYKIDDIDFECTPTRTFKMKDETISYIDYYQKKYNIKIRNRNQPMLIHKSKPRDIRAGMADLIYLVPELCYLTGLSDDMRNNFRLMKALGDITRVGPKERTNKIQAFRSRVENCEAKDIFKPWDLSLDKRMLSVQGHVIMPEKILFSNRPEGVSAGVQADWGRDMRNAGMIRAAPLQKWCVLVPQQLQAAARSFIEALQKAAQGYRFQVSRPIEFVMRDDRAQTYAMELDKALSRDQFQIAMVILSSQQADRYSSVKRKCAIDRAIPSQVMVKRTITNEKGKMSVASKVAIQMCCKIGGAPWTVDVPLKGVMVVGFDVTHDSNIKGASYGAFVASMDLQLTSYFSAVSPHTSGNELSNDIALHMTRALQKYREINGSYPRAIVMYRDGVGEGQINHVHEHELDHIQKAIYDLKIYEPNKLPLSFVIVTKRINTRIMLESSNPLPGSVVDDVITSPERYDFFLVPQSVNQGTVSPCYYNVIHDTNPLLNPDRLQRLTFKMCHLYYNWSGTVRVPAPCQYAHKLAFLCGQALHAAPSTNLELLLHYL